MDIATARALLTEQGQSQLLRFYQELSCEERAALLAQLEEVDWGLPQLIRGKRAELARGALAPMGALTLDEIALARGDYERAGLEALQAGSVGAVLLAGGQGTRLGFPKPKGMLDIGLTRHLYLFEALIQNLLEVVRRAGAWVPLYVMTNRKNHDETERFFVEHGYFGYRPDRVFFFPPDMVPAVDEAGRILLESKGSIALCPNGNGGWFSSMIHAGLLEALHRDGVCWLNVFSVDNVLQRIADPCFVGATILSGHDCGAKVVRKATPNERVGVLCYEDGRPSIVEYYEMTEAMTRLRNADGSLAYNFGVILNYLFRVEQLERIAGLRLPYHVVHKKVPYVNGKGEVVQPAEPNAYKFETLVLDMIHMMPNCLSYEVERQREFAPIKNLTGADSLDTARELLAQNGVNL